MACIVEGTVRTNPANFVMLVTLAEETILHPAANDSHDSSPPLSPFSLYWCTVPALKPRPVRSAERIGLTTTSPCLSLDYSVESSKKIKIKK